MSWGLGFGGHLGTGHGLVIGRPRTCEGLVMGILFIGYSIGKVYLFFLNLSGRRTVTYP
jgi:hypothetical protein